MNASLLALNAAANAGPAAAGVTPGSPQAGPEADQTEAGFAQLLEQASSEQLLPGAVASAPAGSDEAAETEALQGLETDLASDSELASETEAGTDPVAILLSPLLQAPATVPEQNHEAASPPSASALAASIGLAISASGGNDSGQAEALSLPLAGKRLPAWQAVAANHVANASEDPAAETGASVTDASTALADEGWSSLLESSLAAAAGQGRPESAPSLLRGRPDPVMNNSTISALTAPTTTAAANSADAAALENVPGIPLRSPHFGTLLGNQVLWQARVGNQSAEIRLDPPELGPIEVRISQKDSETHLHFVVGHQATREQLEQAMPRLRELFGQGGLQLGQVAVEQGQRETASGRDQQASASNSGNGSNSREEPATAVSRPISTSLIDAYA